MVMRFTCEGGEFFSDETGCGCVRPHNNAAVTLCSAEEDPVCGWFGQEIQCIAYPCAATYGNLCLASVDPTVASTTPGACPAPGSDSAREYISTNQTQCAASMWICVEGMQQFYDETGCGCEPVTAPPSKLQAIDCEDPRPEACTREYMPVCGQNENGTSATYGNDCTACSDETVLSYTEGACNAPLAPEVDVTECTDPRPEICTLDYRPVCADNGRTYGNGCGACSDEQVNSYVNGEC
jgi:hypothetical protein